MQERRDAGKQGCRNRGIKERRDAGNEMLKSLWMQIWFSGLESIKKNSTLESSTLEISTLTLSRGRVSTQDHTSQ